MAVYNDHDGLYGISWNDDFAEWLAWHSWRAAVLGIVRQVERVTFPLLWPPTTIATAHSVIEHWRTLREQIRDEDRRKSRLARGGKMLPDNPQPWQAWTDAFRERLVRAELQRRESDGAYFDHAPPYPISAWETLRLLEDHNTGKPQ